MIYALPEVARVTAMRSKVAVGERQGPLTLLARLRYQLGGGLLGVVCLMRWQLSTFAVLPALEALWLATRADGWPALSCTEPMGAVRRTSLFPQAACDRRTTRMRPCISTTAGTSAGPWLSLEVVVALGLGVLDEVGQGLGVGHGVRIGDRRRVGAQEEPADREPSGPDAAGVPSKQRTVLYVEDNLSNLTPIERLLARRPGVRLLSAMQGRLCLDLSREHHPDLVLLDLHLPDIGGDEVLRRLRDSPETRQIPVVIVSADATPRQIERLRADGARDYLTKPVDVKKFLALVDEILGD